MYRLIKIILIIKSLLNILFLDRNVKVANYVVINTKLNKVDRRSLFYLKYKDFNKYLNLVRTPSLNIKTMFFLFTIPNFFCYSLFKDFVNGHKNKKFFLRLLIYIFRFSKIQKIILIDDPREMEIFSKITHELKINSLAYMHGRFSKNSKILKKTFFSKYLLWSNFFFKQLKQANKSYNKNNVEITGSPFFLNYKEKKIKENIKIQNVLILDEDFLDFKKIENYLKKLVEVKNLNIMFKKKITRDFPSDYLLFCKKNKIKIINKNIDLVKILNLHKIDCIIASTSTGLLESHYYQAIPIKIFSDNNLRENEFKEFSKLKLVNIAKSPQDLKKLILNRYKRKDILKMKSKIWGDSRFNFKKTNEFINEFIKED